MSFADVIERDSSITATPFPHTVLTDVLSQEHVETAQDWFKTEACWSLSTSQFYSQYNCRNIAELIDRLDRQFLDRCTALVASSFNADLSPNRSKISAHRLIPGQFIGIHTDEPIEGTETHRLVITFTRDFVDSDGGHLLLFHERNPNAVAQIVRPLPGFAVAFPLSAKSFHAVNAVSRGSRYSLIVAFWQREAPMETSGLIHGEVFLPCPSSTLETPARWKHVAAYLRRMGADTVPHSGRTLFDHLIATGLILEARGLPEEVCAAGMVHSVYGTPSFDHPLLSLEERGYLATVVGEDAERLAYSYCMGQFQGSEESDERALDQIAQANEQEQDGRV